MFSSFNPVPLFLSSTWKGFQRSILRTGNSVSKKTNTSEAETTTNPDTNICEAETITDPDMFVSDINNPYTRKQHICIICKYNIPLDYKNPRLLSQFVSPYTGFVYGKHITGLCDAQQIRLLRAIKRSRDSGFMPVILKAPKYLKDPKLFDPFSPSRPNPH